MTLQYSRVVASRFDKDSFIGVMPETFGPNSSVGAIELFHTYGFASRPVDMDQSGACGLMSDTDGPTGYSFLLNDGRIQSKLPEIKPGESFQYGPTGNFFRAHVDGSLSMFTTDMGPKQQSVYFQVKPNAFRQVSPWGSIQFDGNGYHLKHVSQARIDLGAIAGLPPPLNALSSYVTLSAALINIEGTMVSLGANTGLHEPVAKGNTTYALFQALSAVLSALALPAAFISASPGSPCVPDPALLAAIATAESAIAAASVTLPSGSVTVS